MIQFAQFNKEITTDNTYFDYLGYHKKTFPIIVCNLIMSPLGRYNDIFCKSISSRSTGLIHKLANLFVYHFINFLHYVTVLF